MPNILIGVPTQHSVAGKTLRAIWSLDAVPGYGTEHAYHDGALVYAVRGHIAETFLAKPDNHYLVFCDSDMVPPKHALQAMFSRDADIVCALCCKREPPYRPVIMRAWANGNFPTSGGPVEDPNFFPMAGVHSIWGSGLAFTMIKRHVLERIRDRFGKHIFFHERLSDGDPMGEDVTFFWKSNQLGFKAVLDADVQVGHISEYPIYPTDGLRWFEHSSTAIVDGWQKDRKIADLEAKVVELQTRIPSFPVPAPVGVGDGNGPF